VPRRLEKDRRDPILTDAAAGLLAASRRRHERHATVVAALAVLGVASRASPARPWLPFQLRLRLAMTALFPPLAGRLLPLPAQRRWSER
jgi:hypothetical protein